MYVMYCILLCTLRLSVCLSACLPVYQRVVCLVAWRIGNDRSPLAATSLCIPSGSLSSFVSTVFCLLTPFCLIHVHIHTYMCVNIKEILIIFIIYKRGEKESKVKHACSSLSLPSFLPSFLSFFLSFFLRIVFACCRTRAQWNLSPMVRDSAALFNPPGRGGWVEGTPPPLSPSLVSSLIGCG